MVSQTRISVVAGRSSPISFSTLRASRTTRARYSRSLYQPGARADDGEGGAGTLGADDHIVDVGRVLQHHQVAVMLGQFKAHFLAAAGPSSSRRARNAGSLQARATMRAPLRVTHFSSAWRVNSSTKPSGSNPFPKAGFQRGSAGGGVRDRRSCLPRPGLRIHALEEVGVVLGRLQLVEQELDGVLSVPIGVRMRRRT